MIGTKLKLARAASDLTRDQLAARLDGLSVARIEAFECGNALPDAAEIAALAECLEVSKYYLQDPHNVALAQIQYRSSPTARSKDLLKLKSLDYLSRYLSAERALGTAPIGPPASVDVDDMGGVERAAEMTRAAWQLGERPITDVTGLLEQRGIKVLQIDAGDLDGLIARILVDDTDAGRVIVVKSSEKTDRMRFTLAHEIGHMVLSPGPGLDAEAAMNRFAGAFLMPRGPFLAELGQTPAPGLGHLARLSARYGVSMQALAARSHELGLVDDAQKARLMKGLDGGQTRSTRFAESKNQLARLCRQALARGLIDVQQAEALLDEPVMDVADFLAQRADEMFAPYPYAVVRLATYSSPDMPTPILIFCSVEMLTRERDRPVSGRRQVYKMPAAHGGGEIRFDRVATDGREAVAWYAEAGRGRLAVPAPLEEADRERGVHGTAVKAGALSHEPGWPELALSLERDPLLDRDWSGQSAPFTGVGARPARLNRLIALPDDRLAALAQDRGAMAFLAGRVHIDLRQYPEYRGGLALVAADPIVQTANMFVRPRTGAAGGGEDVVVRLVPRQGSNLDGLRLTLFEVRAGAINRFETVDVPADGLISSRRQYETASVGFVVTHRDFGVLRHQTPAPFLRFDPQRQGRSSKALDPLRQLSLGDASRRRVAEASRAGQQWLDDADAARIHMRDLLQGARERVWFADPKMTGAGVFDYVGTIPRRGVEIRLITTSAALASRLGADADPSSTALGGLFAEQIDAMSRQGYANIVASVLPDDATSLEGCFLVVDDDAWTSSASFDRLGETSTLILKVPDASAVISRLSYLRAHALPFPGALQSMRGPDRDSS